MNKPFLFRTYYVSETSLNSQMSSASLRVQEHVSRYSAYPSLLFLNLSIGAWWQTFNLKLLSKLKQEDPKFKVSKASGLGKAGGLGEVDGSAGKVLHRLEDPRFLSHMYPM